MKNLIGLFTLVTFLLVGSSFTTIDSSFKSWKKLGSKKVNYRLDKDVIKVGANDGTLNKLKVYVTGGSINMHKMLVEYGNGSKDNINLRYTFSKRSDSRVIDLQGKNRVIKKITFWYDTKNFSGQKAKVHVFGRH